MEYAPSGNLETYLKQKGKFTYELTRFYAAEVVSAIGKVLFLIA